MQIKAKLIEHDCFIVDVPMLGSTIQDRVELLNLIEASEEKIGTSIIADWLSPEFFTSNFWRTWQSTFTLKPWHSAAKFSRYLHRFRAEFPID